MKENSCNRGLSCFTERKQNIWPGPTIILECSSCGKHIEQKILTSGFSRFWTDGKRTSPILPEQHWLVKCQHCGSLIWINQQTKVGSTLLWLKHKFPDAIPVLTPKFEDYAGFLNKIVGDKVKKFYVRLHAWWAGNDKRRGESNQMPLDSFEVKNLRTFITLLDETDDENRLMKAEALRELGEFAAAEKLLATKFAKEMKEAVSFIRDLNQKKITMVQEM